MPARESWEKGCAEMKATEFKKTLKLREEPRETDSKNIEFLSRAFVLIQRRLVEIDELKLKTQEAIRLNQSPWLLSKFHRQARDLDEWMEFNQRLLHVIMGGS